MSFRAERVFDRVLVVMFENQYRSYILANPFFRRLADQGIELGNYNGVMHPSQTNYIAAVAGELCGVTEDDPPRALLEQRTIVDLLEEAPGHLRWKGYMESFDPAANRWSLTLKPADAGPYYVKHNPFASFNGIVRCERRWEQIDSEAGFFADVLNNDLPEFAWFTPNMWSDGHWLDGTQEESKPRAPKLVDQQARWLSAFFGRLNFPGPKSHLPKGTLVVVTFDESDFEATWTAGQVSTYDGPNQIYTVLLGDMLEPGFREEGYNHYSLLRTNEQNFNLGTLGKNDFNASWFQFLWGREFHWEPAPPSPFTGAGSMAAAGFGGALYVAQVTDPKTITCRTYAEGRWSAPVVLSVVNVASISLASTFTTLVMALRLADGSVVAMTYDDQAGWSLPGEVDPGPVDSLVLQSIAHESALMLVTAGTAGVTSRVWRHRAWCPPTPVPGLGGQLDLALAPLGPSAYLIARPRDGSGLQVATYNTAEFNAIAVASGPYGGPRTTPRSILGQRTRCRWATSCLTPRPRARGNLGSGNSSLGGPWPRRRWTGCCTWYTSGWQTPSCSPRPSRFLDCSPPRIRSRTIPSSEQRQATALAPWRRPTGLPRCRFTEAAAARELLWRWGARVTSSSCWRGLQMAAPSSCGSGSIDAMKGGTDDWTELDRPRDPAHAGEPFVRPPARISLPQIRHLRWTGRHAVQPRPCRHRGGRPSDHAGKGECLLLPVGEPRRRVWSDQRAAV
jgi:hypothetical protein